VVWVRGSAGEPGKTMGLIRCFRKRKNNVSGQGGRKAYFWWTKKYFATATDHTSSNIISRDFKLCFSFCFATRSDTRYFKSK
jgi:hypothetical protein